MTRHTRYAIYYAPPEGSGLAAFGAAWLGWDAATGQPAAHPDLGLDAARLTSTPRKYGFHGTLKPPFRLADGTDRTQLSAAVAGVAARHNCFDLPVRLARLGRFCAVVPVGEAPALAALAALAGDCVQALDRFRAPPTAKELTKRRAGGLSPAQEANLTAWGYPYVLDEFRFHLTLTGALAAEEAEAVEATLADATAGLTAEPLPVREICLFGEEADGHFRILERHALTA
ncbi:MAG: DUF1045 domain-containing protein [Pseudomonadota bacterium]